MSNFQKVGWHPKNMYTKITNSKFVHTKTFPFTVFLVTLFTQKMYVDINLAYTNGMQVWTNEANQCKSVDFIGGLITEKLVYLRVFHFGQPFV